MSETFFISMFGALFAVMNPFVNLPIFLGLTEGESVAAQRRAAVQIALYTAIMCAVVAVAGAAILKFFGISVDAFRLAGGLVLGQIGLNMLNGSSSHSHHGTLSEQKEQAEVENIAFFPMTFPMLVGPGTITTLILFSDKADSLQNAVAYALVVAVVIGLLAGTFWFAGSIGKHMTVTMRVIMSRIMGMILMAIAAGMITEGLKVLLPGLAGAA
ncbi:MarC family protein [Pseudoruegeria sp. SHC-113]|uniref:MarC family protein n=1 Tax=Pseudoruegeria sp. SHC-113 TaxID=2855439 RepID=UPI0021BAC0AC|nr:MarC family protein [Pseudoruegeria sp. SHC-113]MCT8160941.1 MarC family protein [Pseudoruegeria sp. SHC-113]